jgi:PAS domain S-box-containing protein
MEKISLNEELSVLYELALNTNKYGDCLQDAIHFLSLLIERKKYRQTVLYIDTSLIDPEKPAHASLSAFLSLPYNDKTPKILHLSDANPFNDTANWRVERLNLCGSESLWMIFGLNRIGALFIKPPQDQEHQATFLARQISDVLQKFGDGLLATYTHKELEKAKHQLQKSNTKLEQQVELRTQELKKTIQNLDLAVSGAGLGFWEWEINTGNVRFNENWASIVGYTLNELKPLSINTWAKLCHPDDLAKSTQELTECFEKRTEVYEIDVRMRHKNNEWIWVHDKGRVIEWDENNKPVRMAGIHQNIDARKKSEAALWESEDKYRRLVETTSLYITIIQNDKIVYANKALLESSGYEEDDLYGMNFSYFLHPDEQAKVTNIHNQRKAGLAQLNHYETSYINAKKQLVYVRMNIQEFDYQQKKAFMCIMEDITSQKKLEQQLLRSQKLQALGSFAGGIAHDFNNILQIIKTYTDLLQLDLPENDQDSNCFKQIDAAINRGSSAVKALMHYSRSNEIRMTEFNFSENLKNLVPILKGLLPSSIVINENIQDNCIIMGDASQIDQVIVNLAMNAKDAMKNKGNLGIELYQETMTTLKEKNVVLSITDNGPGMEKAVLQRIFDPFFTTKKVGEGTGMGLAVVYGIVESHKGKIEVSSEPGKGANFTLTFPGIEQAHD